MENRYKDREAFVKRFNMAIFGGVALMCLMLTRTFAFDKGNSARDELCGYSCCCRDFGMHYEGRNAERSHWSNCSVCGGTGGLRGNEPGPH
jgi:hypothetical protein